MRTVLNINSKIVNKTGIRADLLLHFEVSALICLLLCLVLPTWAAGLITLVIGVEKEIYDINTTGFDCLDLIADIIGILIIV